MSRTKGLVIVDPEAARAEQVTVPSRGGETATRTYTPSRLDDLFTFFYRAEYAEMLPAAVARAHRRDLEPLANAVASVEQQREGTFSISPTRWGAPAGRRSSTSNGPSRTSTT